MLRNLVALIMLILAANQIGKAEDYVDVKNLYLETEKTFGSNRGYTLPEGSKPKYNLNLGLDLADPIIGVLYMNNKVSSTVDQRQFRYVGLDTEVGLNATFGQIYIRHYSGHMLDAADPNGVRFPEENVIGVRFKLLSK